MARIAFVVTTCHEFEGIKVLSAMLKQRGHEADAFITAEEKDFAGAVERYQPDIVGIYATTGQETWALDHVRQWRKALPHLKVVMGGPHPSFDIEVLREDDFLELGVSLFATNPWCLEPFLTGYFRGSGQRVDGGRIRAGVAAELARRLEEEPPEEAQITRLWELRVREWGPKA